MYSFKRPQIAFTATCLSGPILLLLPFRSPHISATQSLHTKVAVNRICVQLLGYVMREKKREKEEERRGGDMKGEKMNLLHSVLSLSSSGQ